MSTKTLTRRSWSRDVRDAVEIFGLSHVASALRVNVDAVDAYLKGKVVPAPDSTLPTRLATLLRE